jgi:hypothetical protein
VYTRFVNGVRNLVRKYACGHTRYTLFDLHTLRGRKERGEYINLELMATTQNIVINRNIIPKHLDL